MPKPATMSHLAERGTDVLLKCSKLRDKADPHPVHQIRFDKLVKRFGGDTTLDDLEARFQCRCGAPVEAGVVVFSAPRGAGGFNPKG